jgi:hypothetical protein
VLVGHRGGSWQPPTGFHTVISATVFRLRCHLSEQQHMMQSLRVVSCTICACRAAKLIRASHDLQLDTGMLLAVPIPTAAAAEGAAIQQAIQDSLQEADAKGIAGAEVSEPVQRCARAQCVCRKCCMVVDAARISELSSPCVNDGRGSGSKC